MVQSAPSMRERRDANRQTWMKDQNPKVKVLFIFGTEEGFNVTEEHIEYCDIIQADFVDSYQNVTFYTLMALRFVMSQSKAMDHLQHLVIADDDAYINMRALGRKLRVQEVICITIKTKAHFCNKTFLGKAIHQGIHHKTWKGQE